MASTRKWVVKQVTHYKNCVIDKFPAVLAMSSSSPSSEGNSPDSPLDLCVRADSSSPVPTFPIIHASSPKAAALHSTAPFTSLMNSLVAAAAAANASSSSPSAPSAKFKSKIWSPAASCESEQENGGNGEEGNSLVGGTNRADTKEQPEGKKVRKSTGPKEERTFKVG